MDFKSLKNTRASSKYFNKSIINIDWYPLLVRMCNNNFFHLAKPVKIMLRYKNLHMKALTASVKYKNIEYLKFFIENSNLDLSFNNNKLINMALEYNYFEIAKLLLKDDKVNSSFDHRRVIVWAIIRNNKELLNLVIESKKLDFRQIASAFKYDWDDTKNDVFKIFINKAKTVSYCKYILKFSCYNNHIKILETLLELNIVNDNYYDKLIGLASKEGHLEIVKLLLKNSKPNPNEINNYAVGYASKNGHMEIVKLLLNNKKAKLKNSDIMIKMASGNSHSEIVKILLKYIK
jgi:ankyrin repeat protein